MILYCAEFVECACVITFFFEQNPYVSVVDRIRIFMIKKLLPSLANSVKKLDPNLTRITKAMKDKNAKKKKRN